MCSLRALLVPPLIQLVQSLHASSLYSTRVLLVGTNFPAGATACAVSERLGPLLDPGSLAGTNFPADATACVVSERLEPLLDPSSLAGTNFPADATACAVSERLGPLLNPGSPAGMNCPTDVTGLRQLVDRVEFVVAGDLCELYHGSCHHLVVPLLLLVHQLILWFVQGQFWPYFGGVGEVVTFHTVALYPILRVIFLTDGDGTFLTVAGDVHANDP